MAEVQCHKNIPQDSIFAPSTMSSCSSAQVINQVLNDIIHLAPRPRSYTNIKPTLYPQLVLRNHLPRSQPPCIVSNTQSTLVCCAVILVNANQPYIRPSIRYDAILQYHSRCVPTDQNKIQATVPHHMVSNHQFLQLYCVVSVLAAVTVYQ